MIDENSLNFFQKRKLRKYLEGRLTYEMYKNAPLYVQQNERVLRRIIIGYVNDLENASQSLVEFIEKTFIDHKELFDKESTEYFIRYELFCENYEYIKYLTEEEQKNLIVNMKIGNIHTAFKYLSESVIEDYIFSVDDDFDKIIKSNFLDYAPPQIQVNILNKRIDSLNDDELKMLINDMSKEAQLLFLESHSNEIDKYIFSNYFNNDVISQYLNNNKELALTYFDLINQLSIDNQKWVFQQNNKLLKFLDEELQQELIQNNPLLIKNTSIGFKRTFFRDINNLNIMKECFKYDNSLYKYISFQATEFVRFEDNKNVSFEFIKSIDPVLLNDEELINIFIQSRLLSAKGNLRESEFSLFSGYGGITEQTNGLDIYDVSQINLIKKLSLNQLIKLIDIDVNYVLPYLHFNKTDEQYLKSVENAKDIFKTMFPNVDLDDYDEIIDLVFDMQKSGVNAVMSLKYETTDFNIPIESLKLLFNKKIINANSPLLINNYFKSLFTEEDSSKLFKEIIQNTYGEKAVKILEQRKELDVYSINSLEIFDSRILDNFSEEFVNDLISYNIRDFSTFLNIVKTEEDLNLFKDYYILLTKLMGKNVEVMQKAITEFYYNKSLLKEIKDKNLTEEQINSLYTVLYSKNNKYDISSLEELNRFDEIFKNRVNEELSIAKKADYNLYYLKNTLFNEIFNIDFSNNSIKDYNFGIKDITDLFGLRMMNTNELTQEEKFVIKTIIELIYYEDNKNNMLSIIEKLSNDAFARNPLLFYDLINKCRNIQMNNYKSNLLTEEKLQEKCHWIEEYNGVKIYILTGEEVLSDDCRIIAHDVTNALDRDFMEHERQDSMSTVSAREFSSMEELINSRNNKGISDAPHLLFSNIDAEDIVAHSDEDANTAHNPKVVKSTSLGRTLALEDKIGYYGEISFYRRTRNHDKRNIPNGRIKPSFLYILNKENTAFSINDIPKKDLEYAKKYNIPIMVVDEKSYKKTGGYIR